MKMRLVMMAALFLCSMAGVAADKGELKEGRLTLATLTGKSQIELKQSSSSYAVSLPLSRRASLNSRSLHLEFVNSVSLLKHRSQLAVLVNGIVVSQTALDPNHPHGVADIPIPNEYLIQGYNSVQLRVAQHYTEDCEDPTSAELWTQIDAERSYFSFDYDYQPLDQTLADLGHLFDKRLPGYEATIMMASTTLDDQHLNWGALAAQGVALHLEYIMPTFRLADAAQASFEGDAVLIGPRQELEPYLTTAQLEKITGPYIGIAPARDARYQQLIISGTSNEEVDLAAQSFAFARQPFPDGKSMIVKSLSVPAIEEKRLPTLLQAGATYRFDDLGFNTQTLTSTPVTLQVTMPPDLLADNRAYVTLRFNLSYGAALREDSVLNIYLNNLFEKAIRLEDVDGARYTDYEITIPLTSFMPGVNILTFEPVMPPLVTGSNKECSLVQYQNAQLTLFGDSVVEMPKADHYVRLPDLKLLQRTGYPYTDKAYGDGLGVVVRDHDPDTILSAWQLLAKLSQMEGVPLHKAKLSFSEIDGRDLLVLGARQSLQEGDLQNAPLQLKGTMSFHHPTARESTPSPDQSWWDRLISGEEARLMERDSSITFDAAMGGQAVMMSYPAGARVVTIITSESAAQLYQRVKELVTLPVWSNLSGNVVVWRGEKEIFTQQLGDTLYRGKTTLRNSLGYHFSAHRNQWIAVILTLMVSLAWLGHRWLRRYKAEQHNNVKEYES